MTIIDQFNRQIIGFAVHKGHPSGIDIFRMFHFIINKQTTLPKYLSSDNDPLFLFHRWQANLRILEIKEIKSVPYTPESHPFSERVLGSLRREYLDHTLFWNQHNLYKKLNQYKEYYNNARSHWSLNHLTPNQYADVQIKPASNNKSLSYCWQAHYNGLFQTPIAVCIIISYYTD